ncbi:hypothetical protein [Streptomyces sp. NPDC046862]|uniref:hypothetical protein n=1 Tax=Streptomyces sp. NPDC046862 TaxID=3154603 RepID=UPI003455D9C8
MSVFQNGMREFEESATRNGIQALEVAFNGILKRREDVEGIKINLMTHYRGSDGGGFKGLVDAWDDKAEVIMTNLQAVIDELNETLRENGKQQGSANEQIEREYQESDRIFDALQG